MTLRDTRTRASATDAVRVRAEGDVGEEALEYVRTKVNAALDRPGLPVVDGEVRIVRATAHHAEFPWRAGGEFRVGSDLLVVHAREASAHELGDRLQDRLKGRLERVADRRETARRSAAPPPWRGGTADGKQV
ncbi:hypothetical protein [Streptomyces sp. YIM S03343]